MVWHPAAITPTAPTAPTPDSSPLIDSPFSISKTEQWTVFHTNLQPNSIAT